MSITIDINADLGEGSGLDEQLMPLVSSCSIACGGHYGNDTSMRQAIRLAKKYNVKVGAHPSFPDTDNFGRKVLTLTKNELKTAVYEQLIRFYKICEAEEMPIHHIKLHGALYNYAAIDAPTADSVVEAIIESKKRPKLYLQHNSILHKKAENLLPLVFEAFIDRRYTAQGTLVPRSEEGAVITVDSAAWDQLESLVKNRKVRSVSGKFFPLEASTFCIHSDNEHAVTTLEYIHSKLKEKNIAVA